MAISSILVTGGAGFIGSHIVDALVENGYRVTVLDNLSTGKLDNIKFHINNRTIKFIRGDIRNIRVVRKAISKCDAVIHLAAIVNALQSIRKPELVNDINVGGTVNLLSSSTSAKVGKFVFVSSGAVYGNAEAPHHENLQLRPGSPYAASKIAGEYYCKAFHRCHDLPIVILRYYNVYGSRMRTGRHSSVMVKFATRISSRKRPLIYGNGKQARDFIHVEDVARATLVALKNHNAVDDVLNVGTGKATTIADLCNMFLEILNAKIKPKYIRNRREGGRAYPNVSLIKEKLNFSPTIMLEEGLRKFLK